MSNHDIEKEKQKIIRQSDELLLRYASLCHIENEAAEFDKLIMENEQEPIKHNLNNKTLLMIKKNQRRIRNKRFAKSAQKILIKVAIFFLVLIITFSTLYITVDAFKVNVLNFVYNQEDDYTDIRLDETDPESENTSIIPEDWHGLYAPTYLPNSFYLLDSEKASSSYRLEYQNKADKYLRFRSYPNKAAIAINNDEINTQKVIINDKEGYLTVTNGTVIIAWHDNDNLWQITTNLTREEAIKIAESVKKLP